MSLIEMGGGLLGFIAAIIAVWWSGKRSGRKEERDRIDAERKEASELAREIEDGYRNRGHDAARERLRDSAIDK